MSWYNLIKDLLGWLRKYNPKRTYELEKETQLLKDKLAIVQQHSYENGQWWILKDPMRPEGGKTLVCKPCWEGKQMDSRLTPRTDPRTGEISARCDHCHRLYVLEREIGVSRQGRGELDAELGCRQDDIIIC